MEEKRVNEPFLSRWSRRKLEANADAPVATSAEAAPRAVAATAAPAPGVESKAAEPAPGKGPEYREFFDPRVDEKLRRAALKKLSSEPQFNVMDGLDTYIDDYSKPDPIPEAMLRRLQQAKELFLVNEEETQAASPDGGLAAGAGAAPGAPAELPAPAGAATDADTGEGTVRPGSDSAVAS